MNQISESHAKGSIGPSPDDPESSGEGRSTCSIGASADERSIRRRPDATELAGGHSIRSIGASADHNPAKAGCYGCPEATVGLNRFAGLIKV